MMIMQETQSLIIPTTILILALFYTTSAQQAPNSLSFGKIKTMKTRTLLIKTTKIEAEKDKFVLINKKKRQISVFLFEFKP